MTLKEKQSAEALSTHLAADAFPIIEQMLALFVTVLQYHLGFSLHVFRF